MNPSKFDDLTKALATSTSRRQVLKVIAAGTAAVLSGLGVPGLRLAALAASGTGWQPAGAATLGSLIATANHDSTYQQFMSYLRSQSLVPKGTPNAYVYVQKGVTTLSALSRSYFNPQSQNLTATSAYVVDPNGQSTAFAIPFNNGVATRGVLIGTQGAGQSTTNAQASSSLNCTVCIDTCTIADNLLNFRDECVGAVTLACDIIATYQPEINLGECVTFGEGLCSGLAGIPVDCAAICDSGPCGSGCLSGQWACSDGSCVDAFHGQCCPGAAQNPITELCCAGYTMQNGQCVSMGGGPGSPCSAGYDCQSGLVCTGSETCASACGSGEVQCSDRTCIGPGGCCNPATTGCLPHYYPYEAGKSCCCYYDSPWFCTFGNNNYTICANEYCQ